MNALLFLCLSSACLKPFGQSFPGHHQGEPPARYAPDRPFDLLHTAIDLRLDLEAGTISGSSAITAAALSAELARVELHAVDLSIGRVRRVSRPQQPYDAIAADAGTLLAFDHHDQTLSIELDPPPAEGEIFTIVVDYAGEPRRGLHFVGPEEYAPRRSNEVWSQGEEHDSRYWFPCWDYPNDQGTSSVSLTVDQRYTAISNGRLLGVEAAGEGQRQWRWFEAHPHVSYLVSIAVGEFAVLHDEWQGIPVDYYAPRALQAEIERNFQHTPEMIAALSDYLDFPYPFDKYAQVAVSEFMFGGMENISATTLNANSLRDATAAREGSMDDLVAHELGHQWFGDMITCRDWAHVWLNEGFASYTEVLVDEALKGRAAASLTAHGQLENYLGAGTWRPIVDRRYEYPMDLFDAHAYSKGSRVLHMLRFELGEESFQKALRHYTHSRAWSTVTTQDLVDACEETTGRSLERFFDQWVRSPGHPQLQMSWSWDAQNRLVQVKLRQRQSRGGGVPRFELPLEIAIVQAEGELVRARRSISGDEESWSFSAPARPISVMLDPEGWLLAEIEEDVPVDELVARRAWLSGAGRDSGLAVARLRTARALGDAGPRPGVVEALWALLAEDAFHQVRAAAAQALAEVGGSAAQQALLAHRHDEDPRVRRAIAEALGSFVAQPEISRALRQMAARDKGYGPRAAALSSLVRSGAKEAHEACKEGLRVSSHNEEIRRAALAGLVDLGREEEAAKATRRLLEQKPSSYLRSSAAGILATWGVSLEDDTDRAERRRVRLELERLTNDPNYFVREQAVLGLGELGETDALPVLRRVVAADPDDRLRHQAEEALARIHNRAAAEEPDLFGERIVEMERNAAELEERVKGIEALLEAKEEAEEMPRENQ